MAKDPAFLFNYKDYLTSTAGWDADVRGWYVNLLCHQADKPEGLPNEIEALAELAGVKFSQFEHFRVCYKRTLQAKFEINASGLLENKKQAEGLNNRRLYKSKQRKRGIVGAFIKNIRKVKTLSPGDWAAISGQLLTAIENVNTDEEIQKVLQAYATSIKVNGSVNGNGNQNKGKGGTGESTGTLIFPFPDNAEFFQAWQNFIRFRKAKFNDDFNESAEEQQAVLMELSRHLPEISISMINQSIQKGWKHIYELKNDNGKPTANSHNAGSDSLAASTLDYLAKSKNRNNAGGNPSQ